MNIGILYPRSNAYPGIGMEFMDGIKTALKNTGLNNDIHLFFESIAFGGNEKELYQQAEKLLMVNDADILVAYVDLKVLPIITPLLYASGKLLLVVNPGANYPENWVPQPNMIFLTLQHAFLCWLSGALARADKNSRALVATSFYDGGYLHAAAMVKSFIKSGGNITFNYVNNQKYDHTFDIKQLTDFLSSDNQTTNLLCVFDSLPASLFYRHLNTFNHAGMLHLFVSPMMLEEKAIENSGSRFKFIIEGYSPWIPRQSGVGGWESAGETGPRSGYVDSVIQETKKIPGVFWLLGLETGLILQQIFLQCKDHVTDGVYIADQLLNSTIDSPRGELKLDPETHYFLAPVYKCRIKQNSADFEAECIKNNETEWKAFVDEPFGGISSGWTNTYLCY